MSPYNASASENVDDTGADGPPRSPSSSEEPEEIEEGKLARLAANRTRKAHKKSRGGCYTCKKRKIKCGEQKPKCRNCLVKSLKCDYPSEKQIQQPRKSPSITSNSAMTLFRPTASSLAPTVASFTMMDMQFFHHFLTTAHPHLPLGNDHVWTHDIPQFAEQNDYLMHAMLALGASHLGRLNGQDYLQQSLYHQGKALSGLNKALANPTQRFGEADAWIATCYALTFQAGTLPDGVADFITMLRGCALTTDKVRSDGLKTAFRMSPDRHVKIMANRMKNLPPVDPRILDEALESLAALKPLLVTEIQQRIHGSMVNIAETAKTSSADCYFHYIMVYTPWMDTQETYKEFLDPNNLTAQVLIAHFVAIQCFMVPLTVYELPHRAERMSLRVLSGFMDWGERIWNRLELTHMRPHLLWPKRILDLVTREFKGLLSEDEPEVLQMRKRLPAKVIEAAKREADIATMRLLEQEDRVGEFGPWSYK